MPSPRCSMDLGGARSDDPGFDRQRRCSRAEPRPLSPGPTLVGTVHVHAGEMMSMRVASASPPHLATGESGKAFRYAAVAIAATGAMGIVAAMRWHGKAVTAEARSQASSVASVVEATGTSPSVSPASPRERERLDLADGGSASPSTAPSVQKELASPTRPEPVRPPAGR